MLPGLESSCKQPLKTVTGKLQLAILPAASLAVQVTVMVPAAKAEPLAGVQLTVMPGQLSAADGTGKPTATLPEGGQDGATTAVAFAGQEIVGACVSTMLTVNEQ